MTPVMSAVPDAMLLTDDDAARSLVPTDSTPSPPICWMVAEQAPSEAPRPPGQTERPRAPARHHVAESQLAPVPAKEQVVDLAAEHAVAVDQLPVEDVQAEQQPAHQPFPAPVITSSGIAATAVAAMTTR